MEISEGVTSVQTHAYMRVNRGVPITLTFAVRIFLNFMLFYVFMLLYKSLILLTQGIN